MTCFPCGLYAHPYCSATGRKLACSLLHKKDSPRRGENTGLVALHGRRVARTVHDVLLHTSRCVMRSNRSWPSRQKTRSISQRTVVTSSVVRHGAQEYVPFGT